MKRFCFILAAFFLVASTAAAQSLAEVAKQEEARRKAVKTPGKVYTDKDLPKTAPATPATTATPASPAAAQPGTPAAGSTKEGAAQAAGEAADKEAGGQKEPEKDETWWRNRITEARAKLDRTKLLADAMQTRINSLTNDWAARDNPVERQQLALDRARAIGELQRLKDEIDAQTKAIADIEEEARQAGVPPGWLR
jgi:hypothetical protein